MLMPSIFGENLFDDFLDDFYRPAVRRAPHRAMAPVNTVMKTDVKETDQAYELDIDLPGYKKEDVKAELKDGYMTVTASRSTENDEKDDNGKYIRRERFMGTCSRSFYVGDAIGQDDIKAGFNEGILTLDIAKKEEPKVEVKKLIDIH